MDIISDRPTITEVRKATTGHQLVKEVKLKLKLVHGEWQLDLHSLPRGAFEPADPYTPANDRCPCGDDGDGCMKAADMADRVALPTAAGLLDQLATAVITHRAWDRAIDADKHERAVRLLEEAHAENARRDLAAAEVAAYAEAKHRAELAKDFRYLGDAPKVLPGGACSWCGAGADVHELNGKVVSLRDFHRRVHVPGIGHITGYYTDEPPAVADTQPQPADDLADALGALAAILAELDQQAH